MTKILTVKRFWLFPGALMETYTHPLISCWCPLSVDLWLWNTESASPGTEQGRGSQRMHWGSQTEDKGWQVPKWIFKKLRLYDIKYFARGGTSTKKKNWDLNSVQSHLTQMVVRLTEHTFLLGACKTDWHYYKAHYVYNRNYLFTYKSSWDHRRVKALSPLFWDTLKLKAQ